MEKDASHSAVSPHPGPAPLSEGRAWLGKGLSGPVASPASGFAPWTPPAFHRWTTTGCFTPGPRPAPFGLDPASGASPLTIPTAVSAAASTSNRAGPANPFGWMRRRASPRHDDQGAPPLEPGERVAHSSTRVRGMPPEPVPATVLDPAREGVPGCAIFEKNKDGPPRRTTRPAFPG